MGYPQRGPWRPPWPYFALVGCVGTPERSVPTRPPKALRWRIEAALDMQIRARLLQGTLGGGGNRGAPLVERLSPSFHCPWLSVMAVLVVVGSIPPGDLFFVFFGKSAVFWGRSAPCGSGFGWIRKSARWVPTPRSGWGTPTPKAALLARKTARFACAV